MGQNGLAVSGEMDWLVKDLVEELKAWGHAGGTSGHLIMKSDNENAIKTVRDAVGKLLGGRIVPEGPPKGESQANGRIEAAGHVIRGFTKTLVSQLEEKASVKLRTRRGCRSRHPCAQCRGL